jgi:energy-coupling factor transporter transmembrane protein EcfT
MIKPLLLSLLFVSALHGATISPVSSSSSQTVTVTDYGATGTARKVTDAALNGTTTVTSATAAFTSADIGKTIWGIEASTGTARLPLGIVTAVASATSITASVSATGTYSSIALVLGFDDSDAIVAAAAVAKATGRKLKLPARRVRFLQAIVQPNAGIGLC